MPADTTTRKPATRLSSKISATAFPFGLALQGDDGQRFGHVPFVEHAPTRADAAPFLHNSEAAEQIGLHVEPIEAAHVARRIDAVEMYAGRTRSGSYLLPKNSAAH
jgi:hypothetical protein